MAELVDALVSNTNEVTLVPVRPRPRVQLIKRSLYYKLSAFFGDIQIFSYEMPMNDKPHSKSILNEQGQVSLAGIVRSKFKIIDV